jgi:hypothetical protein
MHFFEVDDLNDTLLRVDGPLVYFTLKKMFIIQRPHTDTNILYLDPCVSK